MKIYVLTILNLMLVICASLEELKEIKFQQDELKEYKMNNNIIELDSDFFVTQISWTKTEDYELNFLLGVFEGSNEPSFIDGIPIAIIKKQGEFNEINYIDINSPISFKYIRYVSPNKNNTDISPIKIYGYQNSTNKSISQEDITEKKYFQVTNLPLISIHTENSTEPGREGDINCRITIVNEGKIELSENAQIKTRGRTTGLIPPKKPYRIKFSNKQKIFNFKGKEKKWTLLANYFDRSLLRNNLAFKMGQLMGFKYTPRCLPVDVIVNGNFRGNYYICDKIEIGKNRINVTKMEMTDINEPNITGGYLLQIDALSGYDRSPNNFKTEKGITGKILYPEEDEITSEQKTYIKYKLNKLENEIYNGILDSVDLDSYSKYFLVEEFSGDPDHVWSSFYFTKERNDDKFYFGPIWDFDLAFDNDERLIPTSSKTDFCFNYCDSAGTTREFIKAILGNKNAMEFIKKIWDRLCETTLNEDILINYLEEEKAKIEESSELNFLKWDNFVKEEEDSFHWHMKFGREGENFDVSVEVVKNYVKERFISLTNLINNAILLAK